MSHPDGLPDLFLDRSLGRKKIPTLLRDAGLRLVTLAEHCQTKPLVSAQVLRLARGFVVSEAVSAVPTSCLATLGNGRHPVGRGAGSQRDGFGEPMAQGVTTARPVRSPASI